MATLLMPQHCASKSAPADVEADDPEKRHVPASFCTIFLLKKLKLDDVRKMAWVGSPEMGMVDDV